MADALDNEFAAARAAMLKAVSSSGNIVRLFVVESRHLK
jgi:hypothetical protein